MTQLQPTFTATTPHRHWNRRARVLHVVLQLETGGMEKLLVEFGRHADRDQFDLEFICLGGRGTLVSDLEDLGWPVTCLNEPPGRRLGLVLRLARLFAQRGADVIHTHNTKPFLYAGPAARLARVPVVIQTRHGQPYRSSRKRIAAFRFASMTADRVVCVSEDSRLMTQNNGVSSSRLMTVWNGIDVSRFTYAPPAETGPAVMVARLSPEKDAANLVRAVHEVVRTNPEFRLEIAGGGQCLPELQDLVNSLALNQHITFLGEVRKVPELLHRASMFVLPSLTEGLSLTLLEAMASGLPVVATTVGGNAEVVVDGVTGLLVPPADPLALAAAMRRVWLQPAAAREMGRCGRDRVERNFDIRDMVRRYETLYTELARARTGDKNVAC